MEVGGQCHAPAPLPLGKTQYPLYRRPGGLQGRSGQVRKISPPMGFNPQTVQPIMSRYTDCTIPAHKFTNNFTQFMNKSAKKIGYLTSFV